MFYQDYGYRHNAFAWELKFAVLPHRSAASQQLIWLQPAYRGQRLITGPGEPVMIEYWLTPEEFVMYQLKKERNE
jgi:hypothetical protein